MSGNRVERRLAAILAADVAGYSRLIEADEEGTLSRLKALHAEIIDPKIAGHRGRIVKTTRLYRGQPLASALGGFGEDGSKALPAPGRVNFAAGD